MLNTIILSLALNCAPNVAPDTIHEVVRHESAFNEFAVNINAKNSTFKYHKPKDLMSAMDVVNRALSLGHSVDVGLMQVNSRHLSRFNVSLIEAFDPCINIKIGATILSEFYTVARGVYDSDYQALLAALSAYNTGNFEAGFKNGYVKKYIDGLDEIPQIPTSDIDYKQALKSSSRITMIPYPKDEETIAEPKNEDEETIVETQPPEKKE